MYGSFLFKNFCIPDPVSCRCPEPRVGLLATPPRWHATIYCSVPAGWGLRKAAMAPGREEIRSVHKLLKWKRRANTRPILTKAGWAWHATIYISLQYMPDNILSSLFNNSSFPCISGLKVLFKFMNHIMVIKDRMFTFGWPLNSSALKQWTFGLFSL